MIINLAKYYGATVHLYLSMRTFDYGLVIQDNIVDEHEFEMTPYDAA